MDPTDKENTIYKMTSEKFKTNGSLGVTAQDHRNIGSTPPEILAQNSGKTKADLMSEQQLSGHLKRQIDSILELGSIERLDPEVRQRVVNEAKKDFRKDLDYLRRIGRLPKEFDGFDLKKLDQ